MLIEDAGIDNLITYFTLYSRHLMTEILPIGRKTLSNQSINQYSKYYSKKTLKYLCCFQ